jgi:endonuclease III
VGRLCISLPYTFNLDLSMYPSFLSSYYSRVRRGYWRRILLPSLEVYADGPSRLCCEGSSCSRELLESLSGLWCWDECRRGLRSAPEPLAARVGELLALYSGLTVSAAPWEDRLLIASAVVLSRRTSYAWNVRRWMKIILSRGSSPDAIASAASKLPSPQPRLLAEIVHDLASVLESASCSNPSRLRWELLKIKGVGPKTADAIILFTGCSSSVAPADVHLQRLLGKLGLRTVQPAKASCLRYITCLNCPLADRCSSGLIVKAFRGAAGLVQTLAYVHGNLGVEEWEERLETILDRYYT